MQEKERMTPMVKVLENVRNDGFVTDFRVTENGRLCVLDDSQTFAPDEVKIVDFYRFEHDTNPGDMAILYVLETINGLKGTISDAYGTYSDSQIESFMKQ